MPLKRTVPETALFIADVVGLQQGTMKHMARRLREGGFLSQFGHGRGAAEATSRDAATMLLTAMTGIRPLHSGAAALALRECRHREIEGDVQGAAAADPISEMARLLDASAEFVECEVITRNGLRINFYHLNSDGDCFGEVFYELYSSPDELSRLLEALGRKPIMGMIWHAKCEGDTLLEIADWLRGDEAEDSAA